MGSVVITSSAFGARPGRAANRIEDSREVALIESRMADALEKVREKAAKQYLRIFRRKLAKFNTKNHRITITAGMGMVTVDVNGEAFRFGHLTTDYAPASNPLLSLLNEIDETLDYDWAWHLDGESLN